MEVKEILERGLLEELKEMLSVNPDYSNRKIVWGEDQEIETDPLHYISDCVFNNILINGNEASMSKILIEYGAKIEGSEGSESPLIGAVSLSAEGVAKELVKAGADIEATAVHGANPLHWAAYLGLPSIVSIILKKGAIIEKKCTAFQATPLFWSVQGFRKSNELDKSNIVEAADVLVRAGADIKAENFEGCSVLAYAREIGDKELIQAIERGA